ncbi:flagellin lysine-N-methylase [Thorsellia kenyensis]|uniref:Flagellin lysine-N-methylase n=1 Tax=Thorsellia kenyensis TaxID=1549888 RepID=A0ABV6CEQ7_9GAMM
MKELHVTTPNYFSRFQCIGNSCVEHCCRGWSVNIDKETYNKYKNSDVILIRDVAENQMTILKKNQLNYGQIKLNEQGDCPLLDTDKLCSVYKHMGANALSQTCTTYPRLTKNFKEEKLNSLSLSCPEATRLVLFDEDSMLQAQSIEIIPKYDNIASFNPAHKIINLYCSNIIMSPSRHIEENLYAVIKFLLFCEKVNFDVNTHLEQIEGIFFALINELQNPPEEKTRNPIKSSASKLKITLLILFQTISNDYSNSRARPYLTANNSSVLAFFDNLSEEMDAEYLNNKFSQINCYWDNLLSEGVLANPSILKNYFLYRFYNDSFPGRDLKNSLRQFYYLLTDYFYLKTSLSVIASRKPIEQSDIITMFYSYHTLKQHNQDIEKKLDVIISKVNLGDDLSAIMLLD